MALVMCTRESVPPHAPVAKPVDRLMVAPPGAWEKSTVSLPATPPFKVRLPGPAMRSSSPLEPMNEVIPENLSVSPAGRFETVPLFGLTAFATTPDRDSDAPPGWTPDRSRVLFEPCPVKVNPPLPGAWKVVLPALGPFTVSMLAKLSRAEAPSTVPPQLVTLITVPLGVVNGAGAGGSRVGPPVGQAIGGGMVRLSSSCTARPDDPEVRSRVLPGFDPPTNVYPPVDGATNVLGPCEAPMKVCSPLRVSVPKLPVAVPGFAVRSTCTLAVGDVVASDRSSVLPVPRPSKKVLPAVPAMNWVD